MYVFIMHIMSLIIFEEEAEKQGQYHLSLNRDRDRLQKYWAIDAISIFCCIWNIFSIHLAHFLFFSEWFSANNNNKNNNIF